MENDWLAAFVYNELNENDEEESEDEDYGDERAD